MTARKKALRNIIPTRVKIDSAKLSEKDSKAVEKDRFLVDAAFSADKIIITRDDAFKEALSKTPEGPKIIRLIRWINPVTDGCDVLLNL